MAMSFWLSQIYEKSGKASSLHSSIQDDSKYFNLYLDKALEN